MTIERRVRVFADDYPCNPRKEYDCNAGRMYCWHSRYNLGDEHSYDSDTFMRELACAHDDGLEEILDCLENEVLDKLYDNAPHADFYDNQAYVEGLIRPLINELIEKALDDGYVILPVNMYEHSGIALSTGSFSCPWDSGQLGWIVCDQETIDKEWDGDRDKAKKALEAEVELYSSYVNGDVYYVSAEERTYHEDTESYDDWETVDSCGGFYGSDFEANGIREGLSSDFDDCELEFCG